MRSFGFAAEYIDCWSPHVCPSGRQQSPPVARPLSSRGGLACTRERSTSLCDTGLIVYNLLRPSEQMYHVHMVLTMSAKPLLPVAIHLAICGGFAYLADPPQAESSAPTLHTGSGDWMHQRSDGGCWKRLDPFKHAHSSLPSDKTTLSGQAGVEYG